MNKLCRDNHLIWPMEAGGGPNFSLINPTASQDQGLISEVSSKFQNGEEFKGDKPNGKNGFGEILHFPAFFFCKNLKFSARV